MLWVLKIHSKTRYGFPTSRVPSSIQETLTNQQALCVLGVSSVVCTVSSAFRAWMAKQCPTRGGTNSIAIKSQSRGTGGCSQVQSKARSVQQRFSFFTRKLPLVSYSFLSFINVYNFETLWHLAYIDTHSIQIHFPFCPTLRDFFLHLNFYYFYWGFLKLGLTP